MVLLLVTKVLVLVKESRIVREISTFDSVSLKKKKKINMFSKFHNSLVQYSKLKIVQFDILQYKVQKV